jgi:hypothetical protein
MLVGRFRDDFESSAVDRGGAQDGTAMGAQVVAGITQSIGRRLSSDRSLRFPRRTKRSVRRGERGVRLEVREDGESGASGGREVPSGRHLRCVERFPMAIRERRASLVEAFAQLAKRAAVFAVDRHPDSFHPLAPHSRTA